MNPISNDSPINHPGAKMRIIVLEDPHGVRYFDAHSHQSAHVAVLDILAKRIERQFYAGPDLAEAAEILKDSDYARAEDFLFERGGITFAHVEDSKAY